MVSRILSKAICYERSLSKNVKALRLCQVRLYSLKLHGVVYLSSHWKLMAEINVNLNFSNSTNRVYVVEERRKPMLCQQNLIEKPSV